MRISDWSSDVCSSDLIEGNLAKIPGNAYEITQPTQVRFNELIAGVRGDIAVKVFGDDFNQMNRTAEQIAAALRKTQGDRKSVEEGKSVSVRVDRGGRRIVKKKTRKRLRTQIRY